MIDLRRPMPLFALIACLTLASSGARAQDGGIALPPIDLDQDLPANVDRPTGTERPASGDDDRPRDSGETASGWQLRFYQLNWRRIASSYAKIDGKFVVVPSYDRGMASSQGLRTEQWIAENTKTERVSLGGGLTQKESYKPARGEALAVTTRLPSMDPGEYGHVDSVKIEKIIGPEEMLVSDVWLLDAKKVEAERESDKKLAARNAERWIDQQVSIKRDQLKEALNRQNSRRYDDNDSRYRSSSRNQTNTEEQMNRQLTTYRNQLVSQQRDRIEDGLEKRFEERDKILEAQKEIAGTKVRLIGFPTRHLREGERWSGTGSLGPQIAIVQDDSGGDSSRSSRRAKAPSQVTAIDADTLRIGLPEDQFLELLKERGLTIESFAELARPIMQKTDGFAKAEIVEAIEKFGGFAATTPTRTTTRPKPAPKPEPEAEAEPAPGEPKPEPKPGAGEGVDIPLPSFDLFDQ